MSIQLTPEQLQILQHSRGVDEYGKGRPYRNHFVTGPGSADWDNCQKLVEFGYMAIGRKPSEITGGDWGFFVTPAGDKAIYDQSPKPPKLSRAKRRYQDYLDFADAGGGTFREYLQYLKNQKNRSVV